MKKTETIAEYLARGGTITRLAEVNRELSPDVVRKTVTGPANLMTLEEADLFFGEAKKGGKPKKVKPSLKIDLDALPPVLRAKFIAKLKEEVDVEDYEEEIEELEEDSDDED